MVKVLKAMHLLRWKHTDLCGLLYRKFWTDTDAYNARDVGTVLYVAPLQGIDDAVFIHHALITAADRAPRFTTKDVSHVCLGLLALKRLGREAEFESQFAARDVPAPPGEDERAPAAVPAARRSRGPEVPPCVPREAYSFVRYPWACQT